jgi:hypothetical protein
MMTKSKSDEVYRSNRRMEWYFDEVSNEGPNDEASDDKKVKLRGSLAPHMESFFDEITENVTVRCPITMRNANLEAVRSALRQDSPYVDVVYCSIFGCAPSCDKKCLVRINQMRHFS